MKSIIVFSSSHGTTKKAAQLLSDLVVGDVELCDLKENAQPDLEQYDCIVIGGSIHGGAIQRNVKQFIKKNDNVLLAKKVGLYICCMHEGDIAKEQFEKAFPKELRDISISNGLFGGEFIVSEMNFIERQIVKKASGVTENVSKLDERNIREFANKINPVTSVK